MSRLVDLTPRSSALDFEDAALATGTSWVDPYAGLGISVEPAGGDLAIAVTHGTARCIAAAPGLAVASATTVAGASTSQTITITNNDADDCPPLQAFSVIRSAAPASWIVASIPLASVARGGTGTTTMVQQIAPQTQVGTCSVTVTSAHGSAASSANATITILPTVTASVPAAQFSTGTTVALKATVLNGNAGSPSAPVTFTLVRPNGTVSSSKTTNSSGVATWNYKVTRRGVYTLRATATVAGKSNTSSDVTFTVHRAAGRGGPWFTPVHLASPPCMRNSVGGMRASRHARCFTRSQPRRTP